jgi:hypothetical protein
MKCNKFRELVKVIAFGFEHQKLIRDVSKKNAEGLTYR